MQPFSFPARGVRSVVFVALLVHGAPAFAQEPKNPQEPRNLIANGSFENPPVAAGSSQSLAAAGAWSATVGSLELENQVGSLTSFVGDQQLELDSLAVVRQTCATRPGQSYSLSFQYRPRAEADTVVFEVWYAGSLLETIAVPAGSAETWVPKSYAVLGASTQDAVELRSLDPAPTGVLIDDCALIAYDPAASAQLLRNANFEDDPRIDPDTSLATAVIIGWFSPQHATVEVKDLGTSGSGASGKNVVDLDEGNSVAQRVFVVPDRSYQLRFASSPNPLDDRDRSFRVLFAGQLVATIAVPRAAAIAWTTRTYTVTSEAPLATLEFQDLGGGDNGTLLDAAQLTGPAPAPETDGQLARFSIVRHTPLAGLRLSGGAMFARGITSLGDLDGDGIPDLIVGANEDDTGDTNAGSAYVLFLNRNGTVKGQHKISAQSAGDTLSFPPTFYTEFGASIAGMGDIDGDGIQDVAIGSRFYSSVQICFLRRDGTVRGTTNLAYGQNGFTDSATNLLDLFGMSCANMGDFDGDGVNDLLVGAYGRIVDGQPFVGSQYLLLLNRDGTCKRWFRYGSENMNPRSQTLGMHYDLGTACAGPGDIDGDGVRDIVSGAQREGALFGFDIDAGTKQGAVYVLLMNANGTIKTCQRLGDRAGGFDYHINDGARWGESLAALGDFDGNGLIDIAVGSRFDFLTGAAFLCELRADKRAPVALRADFSAATTSGPAPLAVAFTDLSAGPVTSWSWSFGDGSGSSAASPSHTYSAAGVYTVSLTVSGANVASHTKTAPGLVNVQAGGLPAGVVKLGCGVNPPTSFRILSGSPRLGTTITFGVDNPFGTQAPGSIPTVQSSWASAPNRPCGAVAVGLGMSAPGTNGERLLASPLLSTRTGSAWQGPGIPAPVTFAVPNNASLLGRTMYVQGRLADNSPGAPIPLALADGFALTFQP